MSPLRRRTWRPLLAGVVAALLLGRAAVALLTRTEPGRERILAYTLETLGGRLHPGSELLVKRLEGDLFTGARLYDIVLRDPLGEVLLAADSAYLDYELVSFFGGDVVINRAVIYDADALIYRLPTDSLWNYQRLLLDTTHVADPQGRATIIERLELVNAEVRVRAPWEPDEALSEAEREQETRAALSDTSRLAVERVEGGMLRTMDFHVDRGRVAALTVAPEGRGGTYLRVEQAVGRVQMYRGEPLRIRALQGELALDSGLVRFRASLIRLPDSQLASEGVISLQGEEPHYDLVVAGRRVALRDLQWLYPAFPDQGRAEFEMLLETRPEGTLYRFSELRFAAPGTRIAGEFGMFVGDELLFTDLELVADPLDVDTVEQMLPSEIPVRGLRIGAVEIRSPAS